MKKKIVLFTVIVLLCIMSVVLTGCGNQKAEENQNTEVSNEETANNEEENTEKFEKVTEVGNLELEMLDTYYFSDGLAPIMQKDKDEDKWGYIDKKGNIVIDCQYDEAKPFSEGLARVEKDNKWGYIDTQGNVAINFQFEYDDTYDVSEGLALACKGERYAKKYGYLDKEGNLVIDYQYDFAFPFSDGLALVIQNGKAGFIDNKGNLVKDLYNASQSFSEGLVATNKDDKWGYIDKNGKTIIDFQFDNARIFSDGLAIVKKDGKWGYIDKNGKVVVDFQFDYEDAEVLSSKPSFRDSTFRAVFNFSEGLAVVRKDGKYGFIDKNGKTVVDCQYDFAMPFSEGLAVVKKGDKFGYIDKKGNLVLDCKYDTAYSFSEGLALARINDEYGGFINYDGTLIIGNIK